MASSFAVVSLKMLAVIAGLAVLPDTGFAQTGGSSSGATGAGRAAAAPGTNSLGTAQSSGLGSGRSAGGAIGSTDAAVKAENRLLDTKLKSICRGC